MAGIYVPVADNEGWKGRSRGQKHSLISHYCVDYLTIVYDSRLSTCLTHRRTRGYRNSGECTVTRGDGPPFSPSPVSLSHDSFTTSTQESHLPTGRCMNIPKPGRFLQVLFNQESDGCQTLSGRRKRGRRPPRPGKKAGLCIWPADNK